MSADYVKEVLVDLLSRASSDCELSHCHIALLFAIVYYGIRSGSEVFQVSRRKLMLSSKIRANATYHCCLKDLVRMGYISYVPSYDPLLGSSIKLLCGNGAD